MCISCTQLIKATYFIVTYCFNSRTIRVNWALLNFPVRFDFSSPVDWFLLLFTALTRTSQPSRHFVHRMPRRASVFCVSPPGIHMICVWGYTYHCDSRLRIQKNPIRRLHMLTCMMTYKGIISRARVVLIVL